MLISINIPTYNRGKFLKRNLELLGSQISEKGLNNDVEINVSNNCSTDDTDNVVKEFANSNTHLIIHYQKNESNLGPDKNYILAMLMAHGEYSILLGDDDYIERGGFDKILHFISKYKDVDVFLSNRIEIDEREFFIRETKFLRQDVQSRLFDFSDEENAGYYFSLCQSVGGCLTFISSIIYKTSIINEIGPYDGRLDGTFYSYWFYLWGKLARGGKLFYISDSYILNTQTDNLNFGKELDRLMVEFKGFYIASEVLFKNKYYRKDFLQVPQRIIPHKIIILYGFRHPSTFNNEFLPIIEKSEWESFEISFMKEMFSYSFYFKGILHKLFPKLQISHIRK